MQVAAGKIGQAPAPAGTAFEMQVNAVGRLSSPEEFGEIVLRADAASGAVVRLKDVARIELGALAIFLLGLLRQGPHGGARVFPDAPGSTALDLQAGVKAKMEELSKRFPRRHLLRHAL